MVILNKRNLSFTIFAAINILFSIKYFSRYTEYYLLFAAVLLFMQILLFYKGGMLTKIASSRYTVINITMLTVFCLASIFIFSKISAEASNSDRWSVITSFWDNFFNGEYVYYAKSHLNNHPGPMPFYFILALPFYLIGELGLFSLMGIIAFYLLMRYTKVRPSYQAIFILFVITSPFYLWEISSRSNIFLISTLIVFSFAFFFAIKNYTSLKSQLLIGLVLGLMMSTRNIYALCYIILFLYCIKSKKLDIVSVIKTGCFMILTFVLTFTPFVLGHWNDFTQMNPFIIQSSYLMPVELSILAVFCSFFMFLFCRKDLDVIFYSGVILFFAIALHLAYHSFDSSFHDAVFESHADISYFIMCIPFFLYYMLKTDNQKLQA